MTDADRAEYLWRALSACVALDRELTVATVTHWLEHHGAGLPDVPLMQERVREDATMWAASASQEELLSYFAAAVLELERSPVTERGAKRMAALGYKNMSDEAKAGFRAWLEKQNG